MIYKHNTTERSYWFIKKFTFIGTHIVFKDNFMVHNRGYNYDRYYEI